MSHNGVIDLLYNARSSGVEILLAGDQLQIRVDKGKTVDADLLQEIKARKDALTSYLRTKTDGRAGATTMRPVAGSVGNWESLPLSFSQQRLWITHQLEGSLAYHIPMVLRLDGRLDADALESALGGVVQRHSVLRTVFRETAGEARQYLLGEGKWQLRRIEGGDYGRDATRRVIADLIREPFDLSADHMLRAYLITVQPEEHILVIILHHIAADAWSLPILMKDMIGFYDHYTGNGQANLEALPLQYADFSIWQQSEEVRLLLERQHAYWRGHLEGCELFELPADRPRHAVHGPEAGRVERHIGQADMARLSTFAADHGLTLYMVLLGLLNVLLHRYTSREDLCVVSSIAGRRFQELESLIGFFANTLILRTRIRPEMRLSELLEAVKKISMEAFENQDLPFEKMTQCFTEGNKGGRLPSFPVMLVLENTPIGEKAGTGRIAIRPEDTGMLFAKFDLTVTARALSDGLNISFTYRKDLFEPDTMAVMIGHYVHLLERATGEWSTPLCDLNMMGFEEQYQLMHGWNTSQVAFPEDQTVTDLFEKQAARTPGHIAVVDHREQMTYEELARRADELSQYLRYRGVSAGSAVAMAMERGGEMIVGILGIIKAGAAYVPLDADNPNERLLPMVEDCGCPLILASEGLKERMRGLAEQTPGRPAVLSLRDAREKAGVEAPKGPRASAHDPIYIIYTSGTTGAAKGTVIEHRSVVDYVFGIDARTGIRSCRSFALVSTIAADLGNTMIYCALLSGGTLHVLSKDIVTSGPLIADYFNQQAIDCLKIVPSHWRALCGEQLLLPRKLLIFGGEALPPACVNSILRSGSPCRVIDHYGPTETTIGKLLYVAAGETVGERVPVGRPFGNATVYVIDASGRLAATGVPGELYIGGVGVARGYLNRWSLTEERFVDNPFPGQPVARLYRTGDLVRWRADGQIEFLGRIDQQVKIRGYRVEPAEIETLLTHCPCVKEAVVLGVADDEGEKRLTAYIVAREGNSMAPEAAEAFLKDKLPDYMIPTRWAVVEEIPLTANGKVDRKKLTEAIVHKREGGLHAEPRNETERMLLELWKDLLGVDKAGIHDNFFSSGGHSLLAIRLISAIRKVLKAEIPIGYLFDHPTIADMATLIIAQTALEENVESITIPARPQRIPLSFGQERLWFLHHLGHQSAYHIPLVLRIRGALSVQVLESAIREIIRRHEVLRTVIVMDGDGMYQEIRPADGWRLESDERSLAAGEEELFALVSELNDRPFDLAHDHPLRAFLLPIAGGEHLLIVTVHHIATDGWSNALLVREFVALYEAYEAGRDAGLADLPVQYADYAVWQRLYLTGDVLADKLNYWKGRLGNCPTLALPADHMRPAVQSTSGDRWNFRIERSLQEEIQAIGRQEGATLFMTLLAVFQALLYRYTGQEQICVGTAVAGRQHAAFEGLIGLFVNTLVLRADVDGRSGFRQLLRQVRTMTLEAYAHQDVPFEKVVEAVERERDASRNPLFQVMFELQNNERAVVRENKIGGLIVLPEPVAARTAKLDISLSFTETKDGLSGCIEYCTDLYEPKTIERMAGHYIHLLRAVVADPERGIDALQLLAGEDPVVMAGPRVFVEQQEGELFDFDLE